MKNVWSAAAVGIVCLSITARASTLMVGPGQPYALPSAAAAVAADGDTISIAAGTYNDCAVWNANGLTIVGAGANKTTIGNADCWGKGVFVINGSNIIVRGLALVNAVVPDQNGSGIRAEGTNLLVDSVLFANNQEGILADPVSSSTIVVNRSTFYHNGFCGNISCSHGIYVAQIYKLVVQKSVFYDTQIAHDIKSRAAITVISGNKIEDGPNGTSSYLVDIPNGGTLDIRGNTFEKGPLSSNHTAAISIGEEGPVGPKSPMNIDKNRFQNDCCSTTFVYNYTLYPVKLIGNTLSGDPAVALVGPGTVH